jgi:cbb3-type cytochrome oxidase maturation protein
LRAFLLLIPHTLCVSGLFAWLFVRAVGEGQFDDLDDPPRRILHDDR